MGKTFPFEGQFVRLLTYQTGLSHPNMFYTFGGIRYKNSIKYLKMHHDFTDEHYTM